MRGWWCRSLRGVGMSCSSWTKVKDNACGGCVSGFGVSILVGDPRQLSTSSWPHW
jgi:hypothetical protein